MQRERVVAYVAFGSNLGDRDAHLTAAVTELRATPGVRVSEVSPVYETDPVGPPPQGPYWNAVLVLSTTLAPQLLLARLHSIEVLRGRDRGGARDEARTLDLDLLLYGDAKIDEPELSVPHPRLRERGFVLEPLCDVAPRLTHPVSGETVESLAARVRDPAAVRRLATSGTKSKSRPK